jgi:hypothetical protein
MSNRFTDTSATQAWLAVVARFTHLADQLGSSKEVAAQTVVPE